MAIENHKVVNKSESNTIQKRVFYCKLCLSAYCHISTSICNQKCSFYKLFLIQDCNQNFAVSDTCISSWLSAYKGSNLTHSKQSLPMQIKYCYRSSEISCVSHQSCGTRIPVYGFRVAVVRCCAQHCKNVATPKTKFSTCSFSLRFYLRSPYLIIISAICHCHPFKNELVLVLNTAWRKQPIADYVSNHNRMAEKV